MAGLIRISSASLDVLREIDSRGDLNTENIGTALRYLHQPRERIRWLVSSKMIVNDGVYKVTDFGREVLRQRQQAKKKSGVPARTFTKSGLYKGLVINWARSGSLDFLSIPSLVNGKDKEVHPCLKS